MEQLLHYCWKHRLFPLQQLKTTSGQDVEVIDPGLHNRNAGPDFFNAKVKIDGTLWVGNVEIHDKSSDWYLHGHEKDDHYNNVVLHVTGKADTEVKTANGDVLPQLEMEVPETVERHYQEPVAGRPIPALLSHHSATITADRSFLDERATNRTPRTKDREDTPARRHCQRLVGAGLLRHAGAKPSASASTARLLSSGHYTCHCMT